MPYLDQPWQYGQKQFNKGEWVPEMDLNNWIERHKDLKYPAWAKSEGLTPDDLTNLQLLPPNQKREYLRELGADIGSAQRDGFLYANFLEQLKEAVPVSPSESEKADEVADNVVNRMNTLGLTSAKSLSEEQGGPPKSASPRSFQKVMNWLMGLLNKVGRFLLNSIEVFGALARDLFLDVRSQLKAIAFTASIPPGLSFEISPEYFTDYRNWRILKPFIEKILEHMGKLPT
jgi:hypothetical protein